MDGCSAYSARTSMIMNINPLIYNIDPDTAKQTQMQYLHVPPCANLHVQLHALYGVSICHPAA